MFIRLGAVRPRTVCSLGNSNLGFLEAYSVLGRGAILPDRNLSSFGALECLSIHELCARIFLRNLGKFLRNNATSHPRKPYYLLSQP